MAWWNPVTHDSLELKGSLETIHYYAEIPQLRILSPKTVDLWCPGSQSGAVSPATHPDMPVLSSPSVG